MKLKNQCNEKITVQYDQTILLCFGDSIRSNVVTNKKMYWSELLHRLQKTVTTKETMEEFLSLSKDEQTATKDVGY